MNAMIFAAGLGTRLKPLTDRMPKALVPVAGQPLLWHVLNKLQNAGIDNIVVNVHHLAEQIVDYLKDTSVKISDETTMLLETGGGLKKAQSLFGNGEPILVHNVDILSNLDIKTLLATPLLDATLVVSERKTKRYLLFDDNMRLVGWTNIETGEVKSPYANLSVGKYKMLAFAGIHVIDQRLFVPMREWGERFSIIDFYLSVCRDYDIRGYIQPDLRLMDVGKIDTLSESDEFIHTI